MLILLILWPPAAAASDQGDQPLHELHYFWGEGCTLCDQADVWLADLKARFPDLAIRRYEVFYNADHRQLFTDLMTGRNRKAIWVPVFILDEHVWEGFNDMIAHEITTLIGRLDEINTDPEQHLGGDTAQAAGGSPAGPAIKPGFWGQVRADRQPLLRMTVLIAFADGFNPCSLWVLTLLLAMVLQARSRWRVLGISAVFLLITAAVYGLFLLGLFSSLRLAAHLRIVQIFLAVLALVYAAAGITETLLHKDAALLSINGGQRKRLASQARWIGRQKGFGLTLGVTALFALGAAIIELPCTAGFPVLWTSLVSQAGLPHTSFHLLLALYLALYLLLEIVLVIVVLVSMRVVHFKVSWGKASKGLSCLLIASAAILMLAWPEGLNRPAGAGLILLIGVVLFALVQGIRRIAESKQKPEGA